MLESLKQNNPSAAMKYITPLNGSDGLPNIAVSLGAGTYDVIPKTSKHAEDAIKFTNLRSDPDTFVKTYIGEEGKHYEIKDGRYYPILPAFDELIERLKSMGKSPGHVIDSTGHTATVTPFDAEAMKYVMEQMVLESGAKIMYHASLLNTYVEDGILKSVELYTKNGIISVSGKIFVDATGDGDLAKMSGVPFRLGDAEDNFCQPMTMNMKMGNVNIDKIRSYMKENTAEFPGIEDKLYIVDDAQRLSVDGFVTIRNNATASGELDFGRENKQGIHYIYYRGI